MKAKPMEFGEQIRKKDILGRSIYAGDIVALIRGNNAYGNNSGLGIVIGQTKTMINLKRLTIGATYLPKFRHSGPVFVVNDQDILNHPDYICERNNIWDQQ